MIKYLIEHLCAMLIVAGIFYATWNWFVLLAFDLPPATFFQCVVVATIVQFVRFITGNIK